VNSGLRRWDGRVLVAANGEALERRLGDVSVVVQRAELTQMLRRELPDDAVVSPAACMGFSEDAAGVTARFADGTRASGELLVGADGIGSVVRARLFGAPPPSYAGYTAWRGVVSFEHARLMPGVSIGHGCQFGQAPMADGAVYWFATENGPPQRQAPGGGWKEHLLELFERWHAPIGALLAATPESAILHNDILDRPPLALWSKGRVTLLGDAAHPMTPNLGQGANQALEDACALARALTRHTSLSPALHEYESARRERANAVTLGSRRVGQVMQLEHPAACWLRDALLGTRVATQLQLRQLTRLVSAPSA
jgi:2-polyprenyl-6-methoxyphenol hydroxylase-like FAD-dependent oxidoreductase